MNILAFSFTNVTNLKKLNLNKRLITYLFIIFINIINNKQICISIIIIHNFPPVKYLTPWICESSHLHTDVASVAILIGLFSQWRYGEKTCVWWLFKHANTGPAINWLRSRMLFVRLTGWNPELTKNTPTIMAAHVSSSDAGHKTRVSVDVHDYYAIWAGALSMALLVSRGKTQPGMNSAVLTCKIPSPGPFHVYWFEFVCN